MTAADEILYPVGVENLFIAMMTGGKDAPTAIPTYDEIKSIPTIETIGIAGSTSTVQKWASNKLLVTATKNSQFTLTLDTPGIPLTIQDAIMGYIAAKGIVFDTADVKTLPCFAVGFIAPLSDGNKLARWYPKVQVTAPDESYSTTTEGEVTIPTKQIVMMASPLQFNNVTKADFNSARTSATGVTAEEFMAQVVVDESQLATLFPG